MHTQYQNNLQTVVMKLSRAALYEQLAEECAELGKAALKAARKVRNENPTPLTMLEITENIREEISDIMVCLESLKIKADEKIKSEKTSRWAERLK